VPHTKGKAGEKTKPKVVVDTPVDLGMDDLLGMNDSSP